MSCLGAMIGVNYFLYRILFAVLWKNLPPKLVTHRHNIRVDSEKVFDSYFGRGLDAGRESDSGAQPPRLFTATRASPCTRVASERRSATFLPFGTGIFERVNCEKLPNSSENCKKLPSGASDDESTRSRTLNATWQTENERFALNEKKCCSRVLSASFGNSSNS